MLKVERACVGTKTLAHISRGDRLASETVCCKSVLDSFVSLNEGGFLRRIVGDMQRCVLLRRLAESHGRISPFQQINNWVTATTSFNRLG